MTTTIINDHRAGIEALCRRYGVRRLDVFGSAIREDFDHERSDVDFLVEFEPAPERDLFCDYMDLRGGLASLLGREIDLVMVTAIRNRYFKAEVEATRELVYAA